jgi:hypothetical protein
VGRDGDPNAWALAPAPTSVTVRAGAGMGGSDRVTIVWPDGAIVNTWLRVKVLANSNTALAAPDVHYWGNAIGETGNVVGDARVDFADRIEVLRNLAAGPVSAANRFDINRDRVVDAADVVIVDANLTGLAADLNRDDRVGIADVARLQSHLGSISAAPFNGDLNGDGAVNRADAALLAIQFGATATAEMLARRLSLISTPAQSPAAISAQSAASERRIALHRTTPAQAVARRRSAADAIAVFDVANTLRAARSARPTSGLEPIAVDVALSGIKRAEQLGARSGDRAQPR